MKRGLVLTLVLTMAFAVPASGEDRSAFQWQTASPASQRFSAEKLAALTEDLKSKGTQALLIIRDDKIVTEWYAPGRSGADKHSTASLAKAVVGGLSLALAIDDGRITLDDPAAKFIPQWKNDPLKSKILIRHLGSHTSGIKDAWVDAEANRGVNQKDFSGWEGEFWRWRERGPGEPKDAFTLSRDAAPVLFEPGTDFHYSNPGIALLTYCVTASLKGGPHEDIRSLLTERIMRPIGVPDDQWSCGYGRTELVEQLPLVASWGGGNYSPRALARIGRLIYRQGDWEGKQLVSRDALRAVTSSAGHPGACGMGWWTNADSRFSELPVDAVWGAGAGHQILMVVPSLKLIVVRMGRTLGDPQWSPGAFEADLEKHLINPLMGAIDDGMHYGKFTNIQSLGSAPYPPSRLITGIEWAPKETIVRQAEGADNWPLTWADDDHQYTAYGDGWGFDPKLPSKVSMGLVRIEGGPGDFKAFNIRSADIETPGDGITGRKASGILCVDGVLYLLARNAGNAQLAWSEDHGQTWTWADWKWTTSFGCPTFLNFGKNYAGARDEFVYVYSPDSDSAYIPADQMVLARVPCDRIKEQKAYEYFAGLNDQGEPQWSRDVADRAGVFSHPGRCFRTGITYNEPLQRYLWCQVHFESTDSRGPRFHGGFGVYEAPEPWGPWRTVFFTNEWDVGPGETNSFPTKWMSADGRTLHLVFSGDDYFSVRRAQLTVRE